MRQRRRALRASAASAVSAALSVALGLLLLNPSPVHSRGSVSVGWQLPGIPLRLDWHPPPPKPVVKPAVPTTTTTDPPPAPVAAPVVPVTTTTTTTEPPPEQPSQTAPPSVSPPVPVVMSASPTFPPLSDWLCIATHESGQNWAITNPPYSGGLQFSSTTWASAVSGAGYPQYAGVPAAQTSESVQIAAADYLWSQRGFEPWPVTAPACGL